MAMLPSVCDNSRFHFSVSELTNHMVPPSHMGDELANHDGDMDAFIDQILLVPQQQAYELKVNLGETFRKWSEKAICQQFVKENPGSLWGSKFPNILIHKKTPVSIAITCYDLAICVSMGGTSFKLGGEEFLIPKFSQ